MKRSELEIIQTEGKSKKVKCQKCGKLTGFFKIAEHPSGEWRCPSCFKKFGNNKFFNPEPLKKSINVVGKYSTSSDEKKVLGFRAKRLSSWLDNLKKKKYAQNRSNEQKQASEKQNQIENQRKFLEGLGQGKK